MQLLDSTIRSLTTPMDGEDELIGRLNAACDSCSCRHCGSHPKR